MNLNSYMLSDKVINEVKVYVFKQHEENYLACPSGDAEAELLELTSWK